MFLCGACQSLRRTRYRITAMQPPLIAKSAVHLVEFQNNNVTEKMSFKSKQKFYFEKLRNRILRFHLKFFEVQIINDIKIIVSDLL